MSYLQAIREAMSDAMRKDESVFILGEDIGIYGGAFGVTAGMLEEFGEERVRITPISESAISGCAVGAALVGMRPILEIQFSDFVVIAMDNIVNQAAKMRYMFGGKARVPIVVRLPYGAGLGFAAQHSQSLEAWLAHVPGLKIVQPATPEDARGLMMTAIQDNNPVMFYEHKALYNLTSEVTETAVPIPFGKATVKTSGADITVVATGLMVHKAMEAYVILQKENIQIEVIDLRTLVPLDIDTVIGSVKKTGRAVVVHEAVKRGGFGSEIVSQIMESEAFDYLDAPVQRVAGKETPIPYHPKLESAAIPQTGDIIAVCRNLVKGLI